MLASKSKKGETSKQQLSKAGGVSPRRRAMRPASQFSAQDARYVMQPFYRSIAYTDIRGKGNPINPKLAAEVFSVKRTIWREILFTVVFPTRIRVE